jgi:hypothetical protein
MSIQVPVLAGIASSDMYRGQARSGYVTPISISTPPSGNSGLVKALLGCFTCDSHSSHAIESREAVFAAGVGGVCGAWREPANPGGTRKSDAASSRDFNPCIFSSNPGGALANDAVITGAAVQRRLDTLG